jgi:hypothetical protein
MCAGLFEAFSEAWIASSRTNWGSSDEPLPLRGLEMAFPIGTWSRGAASSPTPCLLPPSSRVHQPHYRRPRRSESNFRRRGGVSNQHRRVSGRATTTTHRLTSLRWLFDALNSVASSLTKVRAEVHRQRRARHMSLYPEAAVHAPDGVLRAARSFEIRLVAESTRSAPAAIDHPLIHLSVALEHTTYASRAARKEGKDHTEHDMRYA